MIRDFLFDTIFPKFCLNCQKEGHYVCKKCLGKIKLNNHSNCYICGKRTTENQTCEKCKTKTNIGRLLIAGDWNDNLLRQMIYEYKYRFIKDLSKELGITLINYISLYHQTLINNDNISLFPIPLHTKRLYWRGFNQSELLAQEISNRLNAPINNLLQRIKHTLPQAEIKSSNNRRNNVSSAFCLKNEPSVQNAIKGKIIILVDDICTTGATMEECAKILKPLEPKEIWGLVLARG